MNSMTGFGRSDLEKQDRRITLEIKSVNHRFLDINIRIPRILMFLEENLRQIIKKRIVRGRIDVFVNYSTMSTDDVNVKADMALINAYVDTLNKVAVETGLANDFATSHLLRISDAIKIEENELNEEELCLLLEEAANIAIDALIKMREAEGIRLICDMRERIDIIEQITKKIEGFEDIVVEEFREKLKKRLGEISELPEIDENRFAQEVLYYADKQNITEEIVRLHNHIDSLRQTLKSNEPKGRQLDFIVQEVNREFNTIGSKSSNIQITNLVVSAKSEIEKIREQVQNLE